MNRWCHFAVAVSLFFAGCVTWGVVSHYWLNPKPRNGITTDLPSQEAILPMPKPLEESCTLYIPPDFFSHTYNGRKVQLLAIDPPHLRLLGIAIDDPKELDRMVKDGKVITTTEKIVRATLLFRHTEPPNSATVRIEEGENKNKLVTVMYDQLVMEKK